MNCDDNTPASLSAVPGIDHSDLISSMTHKSVYVSSNYEGKIYIKSIGLLRRVSVWNVDYELYGLSVLRNGNLLVASRAPSALLELDCSARTLENKIPLAKTICQPWHAVQLSTGNFAVCHGDLHHDWVHRVCIVDGSGRIIRRFGSFPGSDKLQLHVPCYLAVDENDFIFVADSLNGRVTLLTPTLDFVYHVIKGMDHYPLRLYLDRDKKCLYVGQENGNVLVVQL